MVMSWVLVEFRSDALDFDVLQDQVGRIERFVSDHLDPIELLVSLDLFLSSLMHIPSESTEFGLDPQ